jgi:hypothetical protein
MAGKNSRRRGRRMSRILKSLKPLDFRYNRVRLDQQGNTWEITHAGIAGAQAFCRINYHKDIWTIQSPEGHPQSTHTEDKAVMRLIRTMHLIMPT